MSSHLDFEGVYDPRRNFAVNNWSDEDFTAIWRGDDGIDVTYILHAGEVKTYPQYLAYYITKNFVDREMYKLASQAASESRERERLEMAVANKDQRKPFEDKTLQEVIAGQESPEITAMREQIRKELIESGELPSDMSSELNLNPDGSLPTTEFPDVPKKRVGRPKKEATKA